MVKNRMSAIDIGAICAELRDNCVGQRLANVYDVSAKVAARARTHNNPLCAPELIAGACTNTRMNLAHFCRLQIYMLKFAAPDQPKALPFEPLAPSPFSFGATPSLCAVGCGADCACMPLRSNLC